MIVWKKDRSDGYWSGWLQVPPPSPYNYLCFYQISPKLFGDGFTVKTWLGKKRKIKCESIEKAKEIAEKWLEEGNK